MVYAKNILLLLLIFVISCGKKEEAPAPNPPPSNPPTPTNFIQFKIGNQTYKHESYGQIYYTTFPEFDTLLVSSANAPNDTIVCGFTVKVNGQGIFTHDTSNTSFNNYFAFDIGPSASPTTYTSTSGYLNLTTYQTTSPRTYAGTFTCTIAQQTNSLNTLAVTGGTFYFVDP
jgi:hypothetical protein